MKSAREMFEELGFKLDEDDGPFLTYRKKQDDKVTFEISFVKRKYDIPCVVFNYINAEKVAPGAVLKAEAIKAVAKQFEELGWLEE